MSPATKFHLHSVCFRCVVRLLVYTAAMLGQSELIPGLLMLLSLHAQPGNYHTLYLKYQNIFSIKLSMRSSLLLAAHSTNQHEQTSIR